MEEQIYDRQHQQYPEFLSTPQRISTFQEILLRVNFTPGFTSDRYVPQGRAVKPWYCTRTTTSSQLPIPKHNMHAFQSIQIRSSLPFLSTIHFISSTCRLQLQPLPTYQLSHPVAIPTSDAPFHQKQEKRLTDSSNGKPPPIPKYQDHEVTSRSLPHTLCLWCLVRPTPVLDRARI